VAAPRKPLSAARSAILAAVRDQPEAVSLAALVRLTGSHENTVREHLNALLGAGLVRRRLAPSKGRGRPAWLYDCWESDPEQAEYAGLAAALARSLARTSPDPRAAAREAGEEWGRELAAARLVADPHIVGPGIVVALLDELRFEPVVDEETVVDVRLMQCPLLETAYRQQDVVCEVHLGLVRGALRQLGSDPEGARLMPFAEPGACLLVLPQLG
jgi:predicted ArsR family transcriptional regulator